MDDQNPIHQLAVLHRRMNEVTDEISKLIGRPAPLGIWVSSLRARSFELHFTSRLHTQEAMVC